MKLALLLFLALEQTKARTEARFAKYAAQGLLCGDDGLPHLILILVWPFVMDMPARFSFPRLASCTSQDVRLCGDGKLLSFVFGRGKLFAETVEVTTMWLSTP